MNRINPSVAIPVIIGLVILFSVIYVLMLPSDKTAAPSKTENTLKQNMSDQLQNDATSEVSPALSGSYVDYKENIIASTNGKKLLFFHAEWCPQCRELEADIKKGPIPEKTTIIKVDFDNSQDLRQKYRVTQQTTIVRVNDDGSLVKKFVAYDEPTLAAVISGTR